LILEAGDIVQKVVIQRNMSCITSGKNSTVLQVCMIMFNKMVHSWIETPKVINYRMAKAGERMPIISVKPSKHPLKNLASKEQC